MDNSQRVRVLRHLKAFGNSKAPHQTWSIKERASNRVLHPRIIHAQCNKHEVNLAKTARTRYNKSQQNYNKNKLEKLLEPTVRRILDKLYKPPSGAMYKKIKNRTQVGKCKKART